MRNSEGNPSKATVKVFFSFFWLNCKQCFPFQFPLAHIMISTMLLKRHLQIYQQSSRHGWHILAFAALHWWQKAQNGHERPCTTWQYLIPLSWGPNTGLNHRGPSPGPAPPRGNLHWNTVACINIVVLVLSANAEQCYLVSNMQVLLGVLFHNTISVT